ncbi:hypothetical protein [Limnohabitans sp. Jir72]|uniref:hypothetical protein n=1 Tax=Limnohabitans sp. Jir72 TaxID=1977909 RepID=UPI0011B2344D|nr:hypothetical protein [Limnohabitans sp. Jir72]
MAFEQLSPLKMKKLVALCLPFALLAACSTPSIGDKQADVPPRITIKDDVRTWDKPGAFGPVPSELKTNGQAVCASLNTEKYKFEARGYHARAENIDGKPFAGGGYYCVRSN